MKRKLTLIVLLASCARFASSAEPIPDELVPVLEQLYRVRPLEIERLKRELKSAAEEVAYWRTGSGAHDASRRSVRPARLKSAVARYNEAIKSLRNVESGKQPPLPLIGPAIAADQVGKLQPVEATITEIRGEREYVARYSYGAIASTAGPAIRRGEAMPPSGVGGTPEVRATVDVVVRGETKALQVGDKAPLPEFARVSLVGDEFMLDAVDWAAVTKHWRPFSVQKQRDAK